MKKLLFVLIILAMGLQTFAQTKIQMRSADKAECVKSDMKSLQATFSFSGIEAVELKNERGVFSTITMPNTVIGGSEGDPQIPVVNQLIAIPVGATPSIRVTHFTTTEYKLEDYGIHRLSPRQPDLFKNQKPEDAPFIYNEAAYQKRGLRNEPMAQVSVKGTLRGVQVGQMSIEPVSYDPVNNALRVFNNIEVEVSFDGADAKATEDLLVNTYSPYFDILYKQLFNGRAVMDLYDEHPDLWKTPVKMLVIANRMFESCIQDWVAWKTLKGIYVDVNYTDNIGTTSDAIKTFIQNKYAQDHPTFLMIMGDKDQVIPSVSSASSTSRVSDLYYSSVDGDEFVDMYHSRLSATSTSEMTAILNKGMEYEQYTMPDPSYLNNVLLIAGEDSGWGVTVGRPTIWYASHYYYNTDHGYNTVHEFSNGTYTNCYAPLSSGVGFANYTAHGSQTSWAGPSFDVNDVANLTNEHKYFLAIGNCCQSGDWGYGTCFGEAMTRAANKGAYAYIGSCPNTTWKNDYYFGVGPTNRADGTMPSYEETGLGIYDAIWTDGVYNTVNSILYVGLLAGNAAEALGYELHSTTLYYWQAYHVLGDGSIMPYRVQPTANQVSHMAIFPIGLSTYEVSAVPGSYVAISKDGVIHGTALVGESGTVQVPIDPVTSSGDVTICVTAPQHIPYIQNVPAAALEGPYISMDSYTPNTTHVGDNTNLSITFKNVGTEATTGTTTVTLSSNDNNVNILTPTKTFGTLAAEATTTVSGFSFKIAEGVADGTKVTLHYTAVNGSDTYEGNIVVTAHEAVLSYQNMQWDGGFTPGETLTVTAKFKNTGHYQATNAVARMTTTSNYVTISNPTVNVGNIAVDQEVSCEFTITIAANCPETEQLPVTFTLTADQGLSAQGNETLKNSCNIFFNLTDSYGDGWNGNTLTVAFDDGTPSQTLTINSGHTATYPLEIGNGVHVTLSWTTGSYDYECSFNVQYEGNLTIYETNGTPSGGILYEFDCNCAITSQTFTVNVSSNGHGTVSGGGTDLSFGSTCTVTATPDEGYMFTGWTENGVVVSSTAEYTFIVNDNRNLIATFAEGNQIGEGTETNAYLPFYNYYNYTLSQQIYTASELGSAGTITSIAFYNSGAEKARTCDLYMKATTKSSFSSETDWITISDSDKVFSGSVTMTANEWTFIIFNTPFEYDGTSNVVLVADDNTGNWSSSPHMTCRVFSATNQAIYAYNDNTDYDPLSPPTSYGTSEYHSLLSVKNQIQFTKESAVSVTYYNITATANPTAGGTINGAGSFAEGTTATLTATANTGYTFTKWTKNGAQVSTNATYSFTVTADAAYVAHFTLNSYNVTVSANPAAGGTVTGGGTFNHGASCTLTATANTGYTFTKWTKNGVQVSTNATYTFNVTEAAAYVAVFTIKGYHITATAEPAEGGVITGAGNYNHGATCTLTAAAADGYLFEAWEENGNTISSEPTLTFTVESDRTLVARFIPIIHQTQTFTVGWGWVSFFINLEGAQGLQLLEQAFGENGSIIKTHNGFVQYEDGYWFGNLESIEVEKMYQIQATGAGTLYLDATPVNPEDHPITIDNGWNWIGYPSTVETSVNNAFSNYSSTEEDLIKTHDAMTTYIDGYGWWGTLEKMKPGKGYMYNSKAAESKTLVYTQGSKETNIHAANNDNLHWSVDVSTYIDNANIIATIDAKNLTLSEDLEVGAFVNGECRGTTRLLYVEPLGQYLAFLTVYGNDNDEIQFKVYDGSNTYPLGEQITYKDNLVAGSASQPVVLHQGLGDKLFIYPNPVKAGENVKIQPTENMRDVTVEIIDATGRIVLRRDDVHIVSTDGMSPGVYTVRIIDEQGKTWHEKMIINK